MASKRILEPSDYWEKCQLFKPMQLQIGVSFDRDISFARLLVVLREFGADVTISSNRSIRITEGAAVTMLTQHLLSHIKQMISKDQFKPICFDNFLANGSGTLTTGIWGKNGRVVFECIRKYLCDTKNDHIRSILCPTTIPNSKEWYQKCFFTTKGILTKHATCVTSSSRGKATINKKWSYLLVSLQAAVTDYRILELMPRLFEMPQPEVEQRVPIDVYYSYFTSPKWERKFMKPVIAAARKMINSDLAIEDRLIKLVRTEACSSDAERSKYLKGTDSRPAFCFRGWDKITKFTNGTGKGFPVFDYNLYNVMDVTSQLYGGVENKSEIINRIKALCIAGVVTDLLKTLLKYGPNPKLRFDYEPDSEEAKKNFVRKYLE